MAVFFAEGGPFLVAVLLVVLWFVAGKGNRLPLVEAIWAAIFGLGINQLIGLFYFHPRPFMIGLCVPLFPHGPENSFPSDHATLMFAVAIYLFLARRWIVSGILLVVVAILTAWGRLYSGIHFPLDMAGSIGVGFMSVGLTDLVANRLKTWNEELIRIIERLTDWRIRME